MPRRLLSAVALTGILVFATAACGGGDEETSTDVATSPPAAAATATTASVAPTSSGTIVEVVNKDLGGSGEYAFDPSEFTFSIGETVTFKLSAETEFHTFTVDELKIDQEINAGETAEVTVTFDKAGEFTLFCVPHEALGMVGKITVQ